MAQSSLYSKYAKLLLKASLPISCLSSASDYTDSMQACIQSTQKSIDQVCQARCSDRESEDCRSCTLDQSQLQVANCKPTNYPEYIPPTNKPEVFLNSHLKAITSDRGVESETSITQNTTNSPSHAKPGSTPATAAVKASAQKTQPQAPDSAQADVDSDVSMCTQAFSKAQGCCNGPVSCLSSDDRAQYNSLVSQMNSAGSSGGGGPNGNGGGVSQTCAQMQTATDANRQANNLLSAACAENQSTCNSSCSSLVTKYQSLYANCNGCDSQSIYQTAYNTLNQKKQQCGTLTAQINNMAGQGALANNTLNSSANCQDQAGSGSGMSPASAGAGAAASPGGLSTNSDTSTTSTAPSGPEKGSAGLLTADKTNSQFNLGNNTDAQGMNSPVIAAGKPGSPPTVGTIPNGGGSMMGGGGGGARASAGPSGRNSAASSSVSTDIERGFRSGGGGANPASSGYVGESMTPEELAKLTPKQRETLELAQFLPGHQRDPASIRHGHFSENERKALGIHGPETNLFDQVHLRFVVECKLGNIEDCGEYVVPQQ